VPLAGGNILRRWADADVENLKVYKDVNYWSMPQAKRGKSARHIR
jgi:hypothetical protein